MKIGFGGGCHWCTEAVFQSLTGVDRVEQGWIASAGSNEHFSEAVIVHFNPQRIPLDVLIEIHLHTHKSTSNHSMRKKYRSAIYYFSESDGAQCTAILSLLQRDFEKPLITQVLPFVAFDPSAEKIRNYYYSNPQKPFCRRFIEPKLTLLLEQFKDHIDPDQPILAD